MSPRDDWIMGDLAAQGAYRGAYPDWPAPADAPAGPMGALAREDDYAPAVLPDAGGAGLGAIGNTLQRVFRQGGAGAVEGLRAHLANYDPPQGRLTGEYDPEQKAMQSEALTRIAGRVPPSDSAVDRYARSIGTALGNPMTYAGMGPAAAAGWGTAAGVGGETLGHMYKGQGAPAEKGAHFVGSTVPFVLGEILTRGRLGPIGAPEGAAGVVGGRLKQPQPKQLRPSPEVAPGVTAEPAPGMGTLAEPPAPWLDPTIARQIQRITKEKGGSTTNINTGERPTSGLMMGIYRNADPRAFNTPGRVTQADLENFVQTNRNALRLAGRSDLVGPRQPGDRYLGTWRDPDTGVAYVDVSQRFDPDQIRQATKFGERTGQIAGWDVGAQASFPVGNWPAYITEPAFHQRMHEMADVGRQYLSQHPTREWWTNEPFARVYGEERMPHVAGYTAATAPNAAPRENLQTMSEYMRRHIRGEPVLQPEWRVPEGMMTRSPGAQIGMEQSRALNLDRAFRGATSELQRQKVREEAQALLGDQWAVVLDRHWARLAEDPSRGVFANAQEGVISSAPRKGPTDYDLLKTEVTKAAQVAGRTPQSFSADVWTGIRDTIQRTSELYGQKFRGSAITGESKSYADHFEDLIRDKAQHLGIAAGEMEKRLRSGDANLMSWVLATTPAAWQAYRQYQGQTAASSSDQRKPNTGVHQTARDGL